LYEPQLGIRYNLEFATSTAAVISIGRDARTTALSADGTCVQNIHSQTNKFEMTDKPDERS